MVKLLYSLFLSAQIICTLGSTPSSYNAYLDQRPTSDAMELAGTVNAALVSMCRPNCPALAMFRNSTAANVMLVTDAGRTKILYKPEFFTSVYESYGDGGILAILAHEVGHAIDAVGVGRLCIREDESQRERFEVQSDDAFEISFAFAPQLGGAPASSTSRLHAMRRRRRKF